MTDEKAPLRDDAEKIPEAFERIFQAAMTINEVLGRNDKLNETVPPNWPLQWSADEFANECLAMRDHYKAVATAELI